MGLFLYLLSHRHDDELTILRVDLDRIAIANGAFKYVAGYTVLDLSLDDALEGTGPELRVVAHLRQQVPRGQALAQVFDLDVYNFLHLLSRDLMEDDDLIDAVDELRTEALFPQALPDQALDRVLVHVIELVQPARSDVAGHNDD